jgi:hypothetical protein
VLDINRIELNGNKSLIIVKYQRAIWATFYDRWSSKLQYISRGKCDIDFPPQFSADVIRTQWILMEHVSSAATVDRNFVSHSVNYLVKYSGKIFVLPNFILHRNNLIAKGSKIISAFYFIVVG